MGHPPLAKLHYSEMVAERTLANYAGLEITTLPCTPAAEAVYSGAVFSGNKAILQSGFSPKYEATGRSFKIKGIITSVSR